MVVMAAVAAKAMQVVMAKVEMYLSSRISSCNPRSPSSPGCSCPVAVVIIIITMIMIIQITTPMPAIKK